MNRNTLWLLTAAATSAIFAACGSAPTAAPKTMAAYSQTALPAAVQVPAGHRVVLESVGAGVITYECREKANAAGQYEWVFAGPNAALTDRQGRSIGRYFGPPATWAASDGSALTGTQLAVAPAGDGNIPLQLVKANPASGQGVMSGISHIQRVATRGGVAPAVTCDAAGKGKREVVKYQADYIFWKAM
jgi:hypothetical protein